MRLPSAEDLGVRPAPTPATQVARYRTPDFSVTGKGVQQLGQGMAQLSEALFAVEERVKKSQQAAELSDAFGKATEAISVAELEADQDQDFATLNDRFKEKVNEIRQQHSQGITDPIVQETFNRRFDELALSKRLNVMTSVARKAQDYHQTSLDNSLDLYARSAALAKNPAERELILDQARLSITEISKAGWITQSSAADKERRLLAKVDEAGVLADMRVDPAGTAIKLSFPEYAPNLDPVSRQRFIDAGIGQAQQMRAQLEREEAARTKEAGDKALTDAYGLLASGKLTRAYVDGLKGVVSPAEYKGLLEGLKGQGKATENNKRALAQVEIMLYENPRDAARLAISYHEKGMLTDDTFSSMLGRARSIERQEGPRSGYERSRSFITSVLKPSAMTMDPAPEARMGLAVKEFDDWFLSQKESLPDADLEKKAQAIVKKYSLIDMQGLVRKTGVGMSNDPEAAMAQILEAGKRLKSDLENNRITKEEFDRRAADLNRQLQAAQRAKND